MELHQVRYFLAVCETLNFTRAAKRCGVSTPSLSRAVRALERELGDDLFRRERHLTHMTALGRLMREQLAPALAATETARSLAESHRTEAGARLTLGVVETMPAAPLARYLSAMKTAASRLEVRLREAPGPALEEALLKGEIDVALTSAPRGDDRLRRLELFQEGYRVAFRADHGFGAAPEVPLRALAGEDFIERLNCEFPAVAAVQGVERPYAGVNRRCATAREDWAQAMVLAGVGIAIMPEHMPLIDGIETRPLVGPAVSRAIHLVTKAGRRFSPAVALARRVAERVSWRASATGTPLRATA